MQVSLFILTIIITCFTGASLFYVKQFFNASKTEQDHKRLLDSRNVNKINSYKNKITLLENELQVLKSELVAANTEISSIKGMLVSVTHSDAVKEYTKEIWLPVIQKELADRLGNFTSNHEDNDSIMTNLKKL